MESGADLALKCGSGAVVGTPVVGTAVVGTAAAPRPQIFIIIIVRQKDVMHHADE